MKISENIKSNRLRLNLSVEELASKLEVEVTSVQKWEEGQEEPDYLIVSKLARIFNICIEQMLGDSLVNNKVDDKKFVKIKPKTKPCYCSECDKYIKDEKLANKVETEYGTFTLCKSCYKKYTKGKKLHANGKFYSEKKDPRITRFYTTHLVSLGFILLLSLLLLPGAIAETKYLGWYFVIIFDTLALITQLICRSTFRNIILYWPNRIGEQIKKISLHPSVTAKDVVYEILLYIAYIAVLSLCLFGVGIYIAIFFYIPFVVKEIKYILDCKKKKKEE